MLELNMKSEKRQLDSAHCHVELKSPSLASGTETGQRHLTSSSIVAWTFHLNDPNQISDTSLMTLVSTKGMMKLMYQTLRATHSASKTRELG
jgi:hypothetical protein